MVYPMCLFDFSFIQFFILFSFYFTEWVFSFDLGDLKSHFRINLKDTTARVSHKYTVMELWTF
jgi:hypothetical protein